MFEVKHMTEFCYDKATVDNLKADFDSGFAVLPEDQGTYSSLDVDPLFNTMADGVVASVVPCPAPPPPPPPAGPYFDIIDLGTDANGNPIYDHGPGFSEGTASVDPVTGLYLLRKGPGVRDWMKVAHRPEWNTAVWTMRGKFFMERCKEQAVFSKQNAGAGQHAQGGVSLEMAGAAAPWEGRVHPRVFNTSGAVGSDENSGIWANSYGSWQSFDIVADGSGVTKFYINGEFRWNVSHDGSWVANDSDIALGANDQATKGLEHSYGGALFDFLLFPDHAKGALELNDLWHAEFVDLRAAHSFDLRAQANKVHLPNGASRNEFGSRTSNTDWTVELDAGTLEQAATALMPKRYAEVA